MTITERTFGVEIECYGDDHGGLRQALNDLGLRTYHSYWDRNNTPRPEPCSTWNFKGDGTIYPDHGDSLELVSPILRGVEGLRDVELVGAVMRNRGYDANSSCGLHVHIGADDLTGREALKVLQRYNDGETWINSFMEEYRRDNCSWAGKMDKTRQMIEKHHRAWLKRGAPEREQFRRGRWCRGGKNVIDSTGNPLVSMDTLARMGGGSTGKSAKVNFSAYRQYKTIEFRQHYGTTDGELMSNWIHFLVNLVEHSRKLVDPESRARDNGPMTGLPTNVRRHFRAQIARFGTPRTR